MSSIISIKHISKQYQNTGYYSLNDVVLDIPNQAIFGLLGPNGAGKTTLISILCGLLKPSSGNFSIYDIPNTEIGKIKALIGVVPQEYALYPTLTAYENLKYFGSLYNVKEEDLERRILENLERLGLRDHMHRKVNTFSGGMKRRVNLIASLLHQPKVLFLDEPTVGVDVQSRTTIIDYLKQLNAAGTTMIYTSHLMAEAEDFCTDIAIIDQGKILIEGKPSELIASTPNVHSLESLFISLTGKNLRDV